ncbi:MAG: ABC transporter substrate-binding protein [Kofleriaceae bacterium]
MRAALAVALVAAACAPPDRAPSWKGAGATTPRRGGTLRIALKDSISTLDPTIAYDESSAIALRTLFETLLDYAPGSTTLVPRIAERWELSADASTYTFWLRPTVRFSDGTPIVAADIKYSLERALTTPDSPFGQFLADVVGAADVLAGKTTDCSGITAPSDHLLVIRLAHPNAGFAYVMAMPFTTPQRAAHVAKHGDQLRRVPLATGPYALATWDEGVRFAVVRNTVYGGTQPAYLDGLVMRENIPRDTQFLLFERGEIDSVDRPSAPDHLWVASQPAWAPYVHTRPLLVSYGARFDVTQPPFTDRRVRQAFNYALDKSHTTKLLANTSVPSHGILPPGVPGRDESLAPYPHDVAKARALLADAGFANGLSVTFVTLADEEAEKIAASMQGDLAEAGIAMTISLVPFATYVSSIGKRGGPAFAFTGWLGDSPDPTNFLDVKFHSRGTTGEVATNDAFYVNGELDAILDAAKADPDPSSRSARYRRAEQILYADAPWLWNYHQAVVEVTQPYLRDYEPHPVWVRDFNTAWLDLGPGGERIER